MRGRSCVWLLATVVALPAVAALQPSELAPEFTTEASLAGSAFTYTLKAELAKGPVVVYFYPSAYTGGCNVQAHAFAMENVEKALETVQRLAKKPK